MKISGGKHYVSLDYLLCINNNKKKLYTHRKRPRQYVSKRLCFFCSKWGSCLLHVMEIIIFLVGALLLSTGYLVPPHSGHLCVPTVAMNEWMDMPWCAFNSWKMFFKYLLNKGLNKHNQEPWKHLASPLRGSPRIPGLRVHLSGNTQCWYFSSC